MSPAAQVRLVDALRQAARPLQPMEGDGLKGLIDFVGDARLVLIGEASHGTHEFYQTRAELTKRLIEQKGFQAVAVEADWPDAYRVHRYVHGVGDDRSPEMALRGFQGFPSWMWRNSVVLNFVNWLRRFNDAQADKSRTVGFYGLDLYSMYASIQAVLHYLDKFDPEAAQRARYRYSCFEHFGEDSQSYGYAASFGLTTSCRDEAIKQLLEMQRQADTHAQRSGATRMESLAEEQFYAEQNARLVKNAEEYYRSMFEQRVSSWNVRDRHMAETLENLVAFLQQRQQKPVKIIVWEHNSHLGDARATQMGREGEWNVGQLVRERYQADAVLLGFSTYTGSVMAASDWGVPPKHQFVRPALPESYEALFHQTGLQYFWLNLREHSLAVEMLRQERLERAIGVVYVPETERASHYFAAELPAQFDAIIHIDETHALEPLEHVQKPQPQEVPETFPSAV